MGTALAMVLAETIMKLAYGEITKLKFKKLMSVIRMNITLPGVFLDPAIRGYLDLAEAVKDVDAVLFVLPTKVIRLVAKN